MNIHESKGSIIHPLQKYKLVFLGDQSVGKTAIINRFMFDTFDDKEHPTVGIDFISKTLYYEDRTIRLQLWDTAGQERFRTLIPSYIRDSAVAIICYDITNPQSFQNAPNWIKDVKAERGQEVILCLIGNKSDLADKRKVTVLEGQTLAKEYDILFMEVSAKKGDNIENLFKLISQSLPGADVSAIMQNQVNGQQDANNGNFQLDNKQDDKQGIKDKKKCC